MPEPTYTITESTADSLSLQRASSDTAQSEDSLEGYLDKTISDICPNGYHDAEKSHCAHFVSHVKDYSFRNTATCTNIGWNPEGKRGACIRVNEIFSHCPEAGKWNDKPSNLDSCLAFITLSSNVDLTAKTMSDHPKKHVGIYSNEMIYHYSNTQDKVIKQTPSDFSQHYTGDNIEVFYGTFPI